MNGETSRKDSGVDCEEMITKPFIKEVEEDNIGDDGIDTSYIYV